MLLYTIGSNKKHMRDFFEKIKFHNIKMLVDVRLSNKTQFAGFTKGGEDDLGYALWEICRCEYRHCIDYAPTKEILDDFKKKKITWLEYEEKYRALMIERNSVQDFIDLFYEIYDPVCLLCAEPTDKHCHRRLFAEMIKEKLPETEIIPI